MYYYRIALFIPPSHRRRGATAVLVRHKPQWHRHDRRDSTVVPSLIVVAPLKTVKTADLRGGTAATFNMFRGASTVLVPSHRGRGATAMLVRHKPHWHRHDRRGSASDRRSTAEKVNIADLRGGTAETLNMFKTSAGHRGLGQSAVGSPRHRHDRRGTTVAPPWHRRGTAVAPPWHRRGTAVAPPWHRHDRRGTVQVPQ